MSGHAPSAKEPTPRALGDRDDGEVLQPPFIPAATRNALAQVRLAF
jgi:hypothetical protein